MFTDFVDLPLQQ